MSDIFIKELTVFIIYECDEKLVTDILKLWQLDMIYFVFNSAVMNVTVKNMLYQDIHFTTGLKRSYIFNFFFFKPLHETIFQVFHEKYEILYIFVDSVICILHSQSVNCPVFITPPSFMLIGCVCGVEPIWSKLSVCSISQICCVGDLFAIMLISCMGQNNCKDFLFACNLASFAACEQSAAKICEYRYRNGEVISWFICKLKCKTVFVSKQF